MLKLCVKINLCSPPLYVLSVIQNQVSMKRECSVELPCQLLKQVGTGVTDDRGDPCVRWQVIVSAELHTKDDRLIKEIL